MHVLVADDNLGVREALTLLFSIHDLEVEVAASPEEALAIVREGRTGVVVQDMNFTAAATTGEEGQALFRRLRQIDPDLPVILMTAWTSVEAAVELVRDGADDYLGKPWDDGRLVDTVRRLMTLREVAAPRATGVDVDLAGLVYAGPEMHAVVRLALRIAPADVPVLITGPSGSGKERLAQVVQRNSTRRDGPFVVINAGALPSELLLVELFGAEAGAYTGSRGVRKGHFETADGGTLFLDEIGNLSADGQAALLRVLQSGEFHRLGSSAPRRTNVRVIAATNADLHEAIGAGRFREDLYYRLAVIELRIPALCERPDDIEPLAEHFLAAEGLGPETLGGTVRRALREHSWPGNVRELQNRIQRAVLVRTSSRIGTADLGLADRTIQAATGAEPSDERRELERALDDADGLVSRAAEALGISRQALYRRMARHGLSVERKVRR